MNKTLTLLSSLALAGCAHHENKLAATTPAAAAPAPMVDTPDSAVRATKPPASLAASQFSAPVPVMRMLSNGAKLLVVENHAVPLVAIDVLIQTGTDGEPVGKGGLAKFVAALLSEGTKTRNATQFAEQVEDLALQISPMAGQETTQVVFNSIKDTLPQGLDLLADMVVNPAFPKESIERERGLLVSDLEQKQSNPQLLARDELSRILYGDKSPWGQPSGGTPATLKSITAADLVKFHDLYFRPANAIISVSGDVTADEIAKLLEEKLVSWKKRPRVAVKIPKVLVPKHTITLVDKPGASQSQVWTFGPAVAANDPDATPLRLASYIVGGPFARLDLNIRENKGYSYGVRATVSLLKNHGYWLAQGGIKANVTAEALTEFENELGAFSNGQLKDGELAAAKEALTRSLPSTLERNNAVAMSMAALAFNGLPLDYYKNLAAAVDKVDAAAVARVAAKYDRPKDWSIVIVGPRAESEEKLKALKLGDITFKDAAKK